MTQAVRVTQSQQISQNLVPVASCIARGAPSTLRLVFRIKTCSCKEEWNEYWKSHIIWHLPERVHGFVAGCVWGDDSSWKIEYLDLSKADEGISLIGRPGLGTSRCQITCIWIRRFTAKWTMNSRHVSPSMFNGISISTQGKNLQMPIGAAKRPNRSSSAALRFRPAPRSHGPAPPHG